MNAEDLLKHFDRIAEAPDAVAHLRRFILDLAVRGKLVEQDPNDEPASELLKRIQLEKEKLVKEGKIRKSSPLPVLEKDDELFKLPKNWVWTRVGEVFNYDAGQKREPAEMIPDRWLLELEDIEKNTSIILEKFTVSDRNSRSTKSEFQVGDILYGKLRPYLNKVVVATEPGYSTTEIVAIRAFIPFCSDYCCLAFRRSDFVDYVNRVGQGTKMPRLRTQDALMAVFPLPPLAEQHRIVTKVDELMELCDRLQAAQQNRESQRDRLVAASLHHLNQSADGEFGDRARFYFSHLSRLTVRSEHIKELRQTILNLAVRGKLVPQDPNDESASELLEWIQTEKLKSEKAGLLKKDKSIWEGLSKEAPFNLPSNWIWTRLQDVFEISRGGSPRPAGDPRYFGGTIPWITVREITKDNEKYLFKTDTGLTEEGSTRSRFINPGDLLLTNSGATLGVPKISKIRGCMNDGVAVLRLFHAENINDFAFLYLNSQTQAFRQINQGMGQPNLNTPIIAGWFFPLPPLAEQHRIVAKVDELMVLCDQLETQLTTTQTHSRQLLESLLHQALAPSI